MTNCIFSITFLVCGDYLTTRIRSLTETLSSLGYDTREIAVYLALLELGEASAQTIAAVAQIERTGVYDVLRRLCTGGLVSEIIRRGGRRYTAEPPRLLEERLTKQLEAVRAVLPLLESAYNLHPTKPTIRFYEGAEGLQTVLNQTLTAPDRQLLGILSMLDLFDVLGEEAMMNYVRRRISLDVQLRVIRSYRKDIDERWPTNPKALRELRYAPAEMIFAMNMYVYGSTVSFLSTRKEGFGLVIESPELAAHQRHLFEALWQISKPAPVKQQ